MLFAGILVGHFGEDVDHHTLEFVKEFGLILFVFTIGLQLGPRFFAALRQQGVKMNALAAAIVVLGAAGAPLAGGSRASIPSQRPAARARCPRIRNQSLRAGARFLRYFFLRA